MYFDSTVPFPYGATVASRAKPSSMPPVAPGMVLSFSLPLLAVLHHVRDMTSPAFGSFSSSALLPPAGIFASSEEASWCRSSSVSQDRRLLEIPVAPCQRPGAYGTTYRHRRSVGTTHHPIVGQGCQPLSLVRFHGLSTQVPYVSLGIRSGRSTAMWLRVAELLSLGFPPSRVPLVNAGQVDLTPLFMCNPLHRLSICPVKERGCLKAGVSRRN